MSNQAINALHAIGALHPDLDMLVGEGMEGSQHYDGALAILAEAIAEAHQQAFDEAAKVAEDNGFSGDRHRHAKETANDISAAIRARALDTKDKP